MIASLSKNILKFGRLNGYQYTQIPQFINDVSSDFLVSETPKPRKRTKIVSTIGPSTSSPEMAGKLIDEGTNVIRLKFSHGDHKSHQVEIANVKKALSQRPYSNLSLLLDTMGPLIRTGQTQDGNPIPVQKGQTLEITTDYSHLGNQKRIACSYQDLHNSTEVGKKILIADGGILNKVIKVEKGLVTVEVQNNGFIGSRKNMCLPGCPLNLPTISKKDQMDILDFGLKHKMNYVAVSFTRSKKDIQDLRKLIISKDPVHGPYVQLISKIENQEAIYRLNQIIEASDGIMVARGVLGMETPIQKVIILQKYIQNKAINCGKFVITATEMLQSMQKKPRPTRAEVADITNSVFDMTDANMTAIQTAIGDFPVQSVQILRKIAQETQQICCYRDGFKERKYLFHDRECIGVIALSFELDCNFIFVETDDVKLVNRLSSLRPKAYIIVFTDKPEVKGALGVNFGVYCYSTGKNQDPVYFLNQHGKYYGFANKDTRVKLLEVIANGEKITGSIIHQIN